MNSSMPEEGVGWGDVVISWPVLECLSVTHLPDFKSYSGCAAGTAQVPPA